MPPQQDYWSSDWYKKSCEEVKKEGSFENKVDQLWQSILIPLFPFDQDYMIFGRDKIEDADPSPDMMVKRLASPSAKPTIIFTMENKRAKYAKSKATWAEAEEKLKKYLAIEQEASTDGTTPKQYGAIGIGMRVRFYEYHVKDTRNRKLRMLFPVTKEFGVEDDKEKIQGFLKKIKERA